MEYSITVKSNKLQLYVVTCRYVELHKYNMEWKKSNMNEYVMHSSIYVNIKNKLFRGLCFSVKIMKKNSNYYISQ